MEDTNKKKKTNNIKTDVAKKKTTPKKKNTSTSTKKATTKTGANKKQVKKATTEAPKKSSTKTKTIKNSNSNNKKVTKKSPVKKIEETKKPVSKTQEIDKLKETKTVIENLIKEEKTISKEVESGVALIFNQEYNKEPVEALNKKRKSKNLDMDETIVSNNKSRINIFVIISIILAITLCLLVITGYTFKSKDTEKEVIVKKAWLSENYVFLGDSITEFYDLEEYYKNEPIVNSGISGYQTKDLLKRLDDMVYIYNPSKVFLLIGTNDLAFSVKDTTIIENIKKIANEIRKNRPHTEIYIISIYPVNHSDDEKINHKQVDSRSNKLIREINKDLKDFCKEKKYNYIDMYSKLQDDEKELHFDYTDDGLHINDEGYRIITKEINKYIKQ
jgi:Lysophospholipase L1 and related esterases